MTRPRTGRGGREHAGGQAGWTLPALHRDEAALGLVAWLAVGAAGLLVTAGAVGGIVYATDTQLEATVTDTECRGTPLSTAEQSRITVQTKWWGITHTVEDVPNDTCHKAGEGMFAQHWIRSGRTRVFLSEGGQCLYDSAKTVGC